MTTLRNVAPEQVGSDLDYLTGRGDPQQRFRVYRLCPCFDCSGTGKVYDIRRVGPDGGEVGTTIRCDECRGEGRVLDLVATCATPQDLGVTLVTLAEEGEFEHCPIGVLEDGGSWLIRPWLPSPRNVSDAGRVLAQSKGDKNG